VLPRKFRPFRHGGCCRLSKWSECFIGPERRTFPRRELNHGTVISTGMSAGSKSYQTNNGGPGPADRWRSDVGEIVRDDHVKRVAHEFSTSHIR
jgi:hypothetical protein